ncbi:uncharacterized protein TOT_040000734 [Theileria orientalis strain Shintoku]|uniref:XPG-I domain-containing protein n=1 Tax=Theileria orientalis strain Shintoku TaxID=869250 RepID=J7MC92_THEOR|nr:uncharacterized protein TOT_040000734 [Theileria orientalis strain Shintoku]BAM42367.1 uncharacterized protein TOT_040000734 [Theileria orientalis strain Shintoku]|eukprot:XP_009692668.1 uncharacterized protein TOT_040000734 [Theileria orientalis strain Shintoku]
MRVRQLQKYLLEQKCVRVGNLSVCKGMRIGLDAVYFFKSIKSLNDPLSDVYSSLSGSFVATLDEHLKLLESLDLQPLFVFQGMQPKSPFPSPMLMSQMATQTGLNDAWAAYLKGDEAVALTKFAQFSQFSHLYNAHNLPEDTVQFLMSYLKSKGHEMIRAPYLAASQLMYFMQENLIDAVVGPASTLLFGVPRVILNLNLHNATFEWVELEEVLSLWGLDREQFVDCCLLAGTEHCLSYPHFAQQFSFANAIEYAKQAPLVKYLYQLREIEKINEYVDGYCIAKSMINYPLVMTLSGDVLTDLSNPALANAKLPSDYHKIVGCRLPKSVYYLMSEGLLSLQLPFALALGEWVDEPTQNVDSLEYRDLLSDLREYQCRALGLLVLKLDDHFKTKQIRYPRYISLMKTAYPVKQQAKLLIPNTCQVRSWVLNSERVDREMKRQGVSQVSLEFCLNWHTHEGPQLLAPATTNGAHATTSSANEFMVLNTALHFMLLENLGYFTSEFGGTAFGKVLSTSGLNLNGLLLLELMKFGLFTGESFEPPPDCTYPPELHPKTEEAKRAFITANLAARVATLCPVRLDRRPWMGRIDFDVASFNLVVKFLRRSINYLTEASLAYMLLSDNRFMGLAEGAAEGSNLTGLPLFYNYSSFLGVVVKCVLLDIETTMEGLGRAFPNCVSLKEDLGAFVLFWAKVHGLLHNLSKLIQLGEILDSFDSATNLVRSKFERLGLDVSSLAL